MGVLEAPAADVAHHGLVAVGERPVEGADGDVQQPGQEGGRQVGIQQAGLGQPPRGVGERGEERGLVGDNVALGKDSLEQLGQGMAGVPEAGVAEVVGALGHQRHVRREQARLGGVAGADERAVAERAELVGREREHVGPGAGGDPEAPGAVVGADAQVAGGQAEGIAAAAERPAAGRRQVHDDQFLVVPEVPAGEAGDGFAVHVLDHRVRDLGVLDPDPVVGGRAGQLDGR
ncbi:hypothetical protein [Kribbella sp. NPDC051770]|uniref:hypothetical protein n=1 Tax=Kribbella sp. NPDC051770 TaxID=3155413 RepID=UPI00343128E9